MKRRLRSSIALFALLCAGSVYAGTECFTCHSHEGLNKSLENGQALSLYINEAEFNNSVHAPIGCSACHTEFHTKITSIKSREDFSKERAKICENCHADKFNLKDGSIHPFVVKNKLCTDCHGTHNIKRTETSLMIDKFLNILIGLSLFGGLLIPISHTFLGKLIK